VKKFRFTADITFDAENIDDAFKLLKDHFKALLHRGKIFRTPQLNKNGDSLTKVFTIKEMDMPSWFIGEMHIKPVKKKGG
jgi:hypothetical protein